MLRRLLLNVFAGWFRAARWFPPATMTRIREAIAAGERTHAGELCFAIEPRFAPWAVVSGLGVRDRARQLFGSLGVWDTQDNSGVLLYLQLAERRVEIVADRGIAARVPADAWAHVCEQFAHDMHHGAPEDAVLACLARLNALLAANFPAGEDNPREFPDEPIVL
jgi:uncharacterized membrane protein